MSRSGRLLARSASDLISGPSNTLLVTTPSACSPTLLMGNLRVTAASVSWCRWRGEPDQPRMLRVRHPAGAGHHRHSVHRGRHHLRFVVHHTGLSQSTACRYLAQGSILPTGTVFGTTNPVVATTAQGCLLIPPPAPGNLTAANVMAASVTLTWFVTAAPGCASTYEILRTPGASGGTFTQVGTSGGNSFTDTGVNPGTTYRYQARTRDADGNLSALSNTVTVITDPDRGRLHGNLSHRQRVGWRLPGRGGRD